ncbi:MAG TPA: helix-turn-helix domain-containing protein [Ignavibacteria bacterium]
MLKNYAQDLKHFRESKGVTLNEIYFQTKIHTSNFEKIESGDFGFQPQTYIRAFLRQYARVIGLDENEVLRNYDLAKSGKYHPQTKPQEEPKPEVKHTGLSGLFEEKEKTIVSEKISEEKEHTERHKIVQVNDSEDDKKHTYIKPKSSYYDQPDRKIFQQVLKYSGFLLIFAIVAAGIYFTVKLMLPEKSGGSKTEIIRQSNFDDVVKEQEKKMLGKKTPEEIQDSISKAQQLKDSLAVIASDTARMTLVVDAKKDGRIIVIADSLNMKKREIKELKKNGTVSFKAKKQFLVTSLDITAFNIKMNGKKVTFDGKAVKDFKITKKTVEEK